MSDEISIPRDKVDALYEGLDREVEDSLMQLREAL